MSGTSLTNLLTDGLCDMPFTGQLYGTDFCGGADRLSVYQYTGDGTPTVTSNKTEPIFDPSGPGAPSQILATDIR